MRRSRLRWTLGLVALATLLEPLGHEVAYSIHYGLRQALTVEAIGPHAYFPAVASAAAISIGLLLAFALLAVGTVHLVLGPPRARTSGAPRTFINLAAIQCVLFVIQETIEALVIHRNPDFAIIAALALCAQLPVAALATWVITRVAGYLTRTPEAIRVILALRIAAPARAIVLRPHPVPVTLTSAANPRWTFRRGPPRSL